MIKMEVVVVQDEKQKNTGFGSYETCSGIFNALKEKNIDASLSVCACVADLQQVADRKPDLVVLTNKLMRVGDTNVWLSEFFEIRNIVYTGSIKAVLQVDMKKTASKLQATAHGIDTARFFTATPDEFKSVEDLPIPFPLFVKPLDSANSDGIDAQSFVTKFSDYQAKVKALYAIFKEPVLVEQYLPGREFTVSIVETDTLLIAPLEIIAPLENDIRILSSRAKTENTEVLKPISKMDTLKKVSDIALASYRALGARDFGRVDIKMDAQERCYFMEANLTPGMTKGSSYFPKSFEICSGIYYDDLVYAMIRSAIKRSQLRSLIYEKA
jgi:D-alanine-D-alanine ligase